MVWKVGKPQYDISVCWMWRSFVQLPPVVQLPVTPCRIGSCILSLAWERRNKIRGHKEHDSSPLAFPPFRTIYLPTHFLRAWVCIYYIYIYSIYINTHWGQNKKSYMTDWVPLSVWVSCNHHKFLDSTNQRVLAHSCSYSTTQWS